MIYLKILKKRGVNVHHSTGRWVKNMPRFYIKFGRKKHKSLLQNGVLMRRTSKIKGKWNYLYRAIDAEGQTLDIWLRKQQDNHSAYVFIKRLIKQFGKPQR